MKARGFLSLVIALTALMLANSVAYADNDSGRKFIRCLNTELLNSEQPVLSAEEHREFVDTLNKLYETGILERAINKFMDTADETSAVADVILSEGDFVLEIQDLDEPANSKKMAITLRRTDVSYPDLEVEGAIYEITQGTVMKGYTQVCITRRNGFEWLTFIKPEINRYDRDMTVIGDLEFAKLITKENSTLFLGEDHSADIRVVGYMYPAGDKPVYVPSNIAECCDNFIKAMRDNDFKKAVSIYPYETDNYFKKRTEQLKTIKNITYRTRKLDTSPDDFFASIEVYGDGKFLWEFNLSYSDEGVIHIHDID